MTRTQIKFMIFLAGIFVAAHSASGQVATGDPPFSSITSSSFDAVNEANLNVMFSVPILSKAGRGMPFNYALTYNSSVWTNTGGGPSWQPATNAGVSNWGWSVNTSSDTGTVYYTTTAGACYNGIQWYYWSNWENFVYVDAAGTYHPFNISISSWSLTYIPCGSGAGSSGSAVASDGSGYNLNVQGNTQGLVQITSLTSRSGVSIGASISGYSGNNTVTDPNGNSISGTTDTLGMTALTVSTSGTPPVTTYSYTGPDGNAHAYTANYSAYTVQTNFGCSGISEFGATQEYLISSISLPDGTSYQFQYEQTPGYPSSVTGRLYKVTLPTGGVYKYTYSGGSNGITCLDGSTATLTRYTPDSGSNYWQYVHTESGLAATTTVTDPVSNVTTYNFQQIYETERQVGTLETVYTCYNGSSSPCNTTAITSPITQITSTTTLGSVQSEVNTYINTYGLPTEVDEYDWGPTLVRKTFTYYATLTNIFDHPSTITVCTPSGTASACNGVGTVAAQTTYAYNSTGNLTGETQSTGGTPSTISRSFTPNSYGVLTSSTDFNTNPTTYGTFTCGGNTAFPTSITTGGLTTTLTWDCTGAVVTSVKDPNNQTTTLKYTDPNHFWRLIETDYPDGGKTTTTYNDTSGAFTVVNSVLVSTGVNHTTTHVLDGLGRVSQAQDNSAGSYADTNYDTLGRLASASNPYFSTSDKTYGLTSYSYDALNRPNGTSAVLRPDGGKVGVSYSSNCQTTTDEANKARTVCLDGLGRVSSVTEDPSGLNYATTYSYDVLNNLTVVTQGSQTRTYQYDWLSRVTQSKTPESNGAWRYFYFTTSGGALCSGDPSAACRIKDERAITRTYSYDSLNRLTGKTYSDSTQPVTLSYDQTSVTIGSWSSGTLAYPKGRLTEAVTKSGSTVTTAMVYSYDSMGRPTNFWQCTPHNCGSASIWQTSYNYDKAGDVSSWTHPAGFTLTNTISAAQLITQVSNSLSDSTHPSTIAQSISYTPWGATSSLTNGCAGTGCTQTVETYTYNNRLQPWMIELGTSSNNSANYCMVYNYFSSWTAPTSCPSPSRVPTSGANNNGTAMGYWFNDSTNSTMGHTATYTYDSLNRLLTAVATGNATYNLTYKYDRYANMTCTVNGSTNGPCVNNLTFGATTNRITTSGYSYDAVGDLTVDPTTTPSASTYSWNAEGRMTQVVQGGTTYSSQTYNAFGQRVETNYPGSSATTDGLYDPAGNELGGYNAVGSAWYNRNILLGGRMVAQAQPSDTYFVHANALGSDTQLTSHTGSVLMDTLYYPWGQAWQTSGSVLDTHYAAFEQSGGNYNVTPNRAYANAHGHWLSPDLLAGSVSNPQSLNRYAYVLNNPFSFVDPLGADCIDSQSQPQGNSTEDFTGFSVIESTSGYSEDECSAMGYSYMDPSWLPDFTNGQWTGSGNDAQFLSYNAGSDGSDTESLPNGPPPGTLTELPASGGSTLSAFDTGVYSGNGGDIAVENDFFRNSVQCPNCGTLLNTAGGIVKGLAATTGFVVGGATIGGELLAGGWMNLAVGTTESSGSLHVAFGVNEQWFHFIAIPGEAGTIGTSGQAMTFAARAWFQISVPVLYPEVVVPAAGATAESCFTGMCSAFLRGWRK